MIVIQATLTKNPDPSMQIMGVYYPVSMAGLNWGASGKWWQTSLMTMIEKQPG
jgi:hypothetical protein